MIEFVHNHKTGESYSILDGVKMTDDNVVDKMIDLLLKKNSSAEIKDGLDNHSDSTL